MVGSLTSYSPQHWPIINQEKFGSVGQTLLYLDQGSIFINYWIQSLAINYSFFFLRVKTLLCIISYISMEHAELPRGVSVRSHPHQQGILDKSLPLMTIKTSVIMLFKKVKNLSGYIEFLQAGPLLFFLKLGSLLGE